ARDHWYPMLVVVDEAQLFAPAVAGEVSDEARKLSLGAMTNLMCRGRKRGLAGVIATQRCISAPNRDPTPKGKRGKTRGGIVIRFTGGRESDSFWACRRPMTWTACRTPS